MANDAFIVIPILTISSRSAPAAAVTIPNFVVRGYTGAVGAGTIIYLVATGLGHAGAVFNDTLPLLTVDATCGEWSDAAVELPLFTISSEAGYNSSALLEFPSLSIESYTGCIASLVLPDTWLTLYGEANSTYFASADLYLLTYISNLVVEATGFSGITGELAISLPIITTVATAYAIASGNASIVLPHMIISESRGRYSNRFAEYVLRYNRL